MGSRDLAEGARGGSYAVHMICRMSDRTNSTYWLVISPGPASIRGQMTFKLCPQPVAKDCVFHASNLARLTLNLDPKSRGASSAFQSSCVPTNVGNHLENVEFLRTGHL
eukprot:752917-Hanusia_phi.AAC.1